MHTLRFTILLIAVMAHGGASLHAEELATAGGTQFSMTEIAEDGQHIIDPKLADIPIDARSRIVLRFDSGHLGKSDNEGRWTSLKAVLEEVKVLASERATAVAALSAAQGANQLKIKEAQKLAQVYNGKYVDFRTRVRKLIGEETFKEIDRAANKRAREGRGGLLQELAEWLSRELITLTPSPDAVATKAPEVRVEIVAFLEPAGQDRKPLHVDNYDNLPEGVLKPLPRTGLQISSEEQGKLNQDLEYARQAAQSIQEIRKQKDALAGEVMGLKGQLRVRLQEALTAAEQQAQDLRGYIETLTSAAGGADQKATLFAAIPALGSASASLDRISSSIKGIKDEVSNLDRLRTYDLSAGVGPALDMFSSTRTVALLGTLKGEFQALQPLIPAIVEQVQTGAKTLTVDQQQAIQQEAAALKADLSKEIAGGLDRLIEMLPATLELANTWGKMFRDARDQAEASGTLGDHSVPAIRRSLNDLVPATVDLRRSGVKNGDYMTLRIRVRDVKDNPLEEKTYVFKIGSMGFYREYTGQLLFASPTAGPSKNQFQANVGVLVTWKYGYRKAEGFGKLINGLKPGLGIHATSLHQGGSTLEVGSGVAISLWDDLLTGGYGWNLGVTRDRPYFFVGIGILDLLHKMNKITLPRN